MKRKIYTSLDNFKLKHIDVISYTELNDDLVEWINENSIKLLINRNKAEMLAGEELKKYFNEVHEQVYFRISGHSYFLDYYLPKYKLAIEIDGSYHKIRRVEDKERDKMFNDIGIRTIRINSKDVLRGDFIKSLKEKLIPKKRKKKTIHKNKGFSEINNRNIQITNNKKGYGIEQNLLHG